jgi:hypothetical protein
MGRQLEVGSIGLHLSPNRHITRRTWITGPGGAFFKFVTKLFSERAGHASAGAREMVQGEFLTILTTSVVRLSPS